MPESFVFNCECPIQGHGTVPPSLLPYVYSVNDLQGQITLGNTGAIIWTSVGNTLFADLSADAGLGTVTSVALATNNSNLSIVSGSPITTIGTITLDLVGNVGTIADLVMAADQTIYSTGPGVFVATSLTAFGRSLIDDANAGAAQTTLGLTIGGTVQAFSQDLTDFVTNATWTGANLALTGSLTLGLDLILTVGDASFGNDVSITGGLTGSSASFTGAMVALNFTGIGTGLTALNASNLSSGTAAVARGGTGIASYTIGDIIYASGATTLSKLADVAVGAFLRSGGVGVAPNWSQTLWPNNLTTGDILYASSTTQVSRLANVATGNVLLSGGVGVASAFGKVTSSHVDSTIATLTGGSNSNINAMTGLSSLTGDLTLSGEFSPLNAINDSSASPGTSGYVFTSTGSGTSWTNQIFLDTLRIDGLLSSEATVTAAGVTGAQTINKMTGTVRYGAAASTTLVITNSLAVAASTRALATVCSNDTTLKTVCAVVTDGFITLTANAAATAECEVFWELRGLT